MANAMKPDEKLTVEQVAYELGISPETVRTQLVRKKKIKTMRVSPRKVFILRSWLEEYKSANTEGGPTA